MSTPQDADDAYAARLLALSSKPWKRWVPNPFRRHLRRLRLGFTLDVGCGFGRNLGYLDGRGVGIDINPALVRAARERGFQAYLPDEFLPSEHARPGSFDALLLSHVVEHMRLDAAAELAARYAPYVRQGGLIVLIAPQERGFRSDATHREFMDFDRLREICVRAGFAVHRTYSHPFPRFVGRFFSYNEFVCLGRKS